MALISDSHKFIFIHIYKTGGTSIQTALKDYRREEQGESRKHVTIKRLLTEGYKDLIENYHVFTIVRNPFSRLVSTYFYHSKNGTKQGFAEYVIDYENIHKNPHWRKNQYEWVSDGPKIYADTILRFESLNRDFAKLCKLLKIKARLPHVNKSHHGPYREYYTPELRKIVEKRYQGDIRRFGYNF